MVLEKIIIEGLKKRKSVFVPGFGAFSYKNKPSQVNESEISPPKKVIAFENSSEGNSSFLPLMISEKKNISYINALKELQKSVNQWLTILEKGETLSVKLLGDFYMDDNKQIHFLESKETYTYFGLEPIEFVKVKPKKNTLEKHSNQTPLPEDNRIQNIKKPQKKNNSTGAAWIISVIFFVALIVGYFVFQKEISIFLNEDAAKENIEYTILKEKTTALKEKNIYLAVAGYFTEVQLANELLNTLKNKGYTDANLVFNSRYKVYLVVYKKGFENMEEALLFVKKVKEKNLNAWIVEI